MYKYQNIFLLLLLYINFGNTIEWEFAVTTKTKILFFDKDWKEVTTAAHQFYHMTALELDEAEDVIYFSDKEHTNASIFSLRLAAKQDNSLMPHAIEKLVQRTEDEIVSALAYDALERNLYWTDSRQHKIMYAAAIDGIGEPKTFLDLSHTKAVPNGLAVDMCRRKLYWTNAQVGNASVESIDLMTKERQVLYKSDEFSIPFGIVVDQVSDRIYWVVDDQGHEFTIHSGTLDGKDERKMRSINQNPHHLTVTEKGIYWTDSQNNAVWMYNKSLSESNSTTIEEQQTLLQVQNFEEQPYGIVAHSRYLTNLQNDEHCKQLVQVVMDRLQAITVAVTTAAPPAAAPYCLHEGTHIVYGTKLNRAKCICKLGWSGERCETSTCHNYCLNGGICSISSTAQPQCTCTKGYRGENCQIYKCTGYCLNDGVCRITDNDMPECECREQFGGERCQHNSTEICGLYCRLLQHEPDVHVPNGCYDICSDLAKDFDDRYTLPTYKHLDTRTCNNQDTNTILILSSGVVLCLVLVLLIVLALRRVYKPARPRIKKTFVVRKEASRCTDTPLTNRPQLATEQCEITIENCCNMNICETPCFDPKLVQQSLSSCDAHLKEDRKMLIHNMEDDLY